MHIMVNSNNMEPKRIRLDHSQSLVRPLQVQNSPQIAAQQLSRQVQIPIHPLVNGGGNMAQHNGKTYYLTPNHMPSIRIRAPTLDQRGQQAVPIPAHNQINPVAIPSGSMGVVTGNTMTGSVVPHHGHIVGSIRQNIQHQQQQQQQQSQSQMHNPPATKQISLPSYNLQPPPPIFSNNVVRLPMGSQNLTGAVGGQNLSGAGGAASGVTIPCVQVRIGSRKFKTSTGVTFKDDGVLFTLKDYSYAPVLINARAIVKCKANLNMVGYPVIFLLLETSCMKQIRNIFAITEEEFFHQSPIETLKYITIFPMFGPENKGQSQVSMQEIKRSFDQMMRRFPRALPVLEEITNEQCIDILYSSFVSELNSAAVPTATASRHHTGIEEVQPHVQVTQSQSSASGNHASTNRDDSMQQQQHKSRSTPHAAPNHPDGARTISYPDLNNPEAWRRMQKDLLIGGVYNVVGADGKKTYCMWDGNQFTGCLVENTEVLLDCSHVRLGTAMLKCVGQFRVKVEQDRGLFFTARDLRGGTCEMGIQPTDLVKAQVFFFYPGHSTIFLKVTPECSARLSEKARLESDGDPAKKPFDSSSGDPSRSCIVLFIQKLNKDQEEALPQMRFGSNSKKNSPIFETIGCQTAISLLSEILKGSPEAGKRLENSNNYAGDSGYERLIMSILARSDPVTINLSSLFHRASPSGAAAAAGSNVIAMEDEDDDDDDDIIMTQQELGIKCPYTQQVMKDPVANRKCKHNYEREAILEFITLKKGNAKCPYAGCGNSDPLTAADLESNISLKEYIEIKLKS